MALKCKHCGESAHPQKFLQGLTSRLIVIIGLVTAALSLFYALREGYFFIEKKQQQRSDLDSYRTVADQFTTLDMLNYAQHAFRQALEIAPNNI